MGQQFNFKVVLAGDGAVGKTSIRERYMGKGFTGNYLKTIGADFASHKTKKGDNDITFQVWDLAGQDSYSAVRGTFYKGAIGALLVFDLQDPKTMTNLRTWFDEARKGSQDAILTYMVIGNKADLVETRKVSKEMAIEFCHRLGTETGFHFFYCETSALTGQNVKETFDLLAHRLLKANNAEISSDFDLPKEIIDIRKAMSIPSSSSAKGISQQDFDKLKEQVNKLEEKVNAMQDILKRVIKKIQ